MKTEKRLEFRLQAVWQGNPNTPPEGGIPNAIPEGGIPNVFR
jgi:hypothetical protein